MSKNKVILIIGNQAKLRGLMSRMLIDPACEAHVVADGETGLRAAIEHQVDLVLIDASLPNIDAVEVVNGVKEHKPDLPIIVNCPRDGSKLERAVIISGPDSIGSEHLAVEPAHHPNSDAHASKGADKLATASLRDVEKQHIERVLKHKNWNQSSAAKVLGIDRKTLRSKIREFHLVNNLLEDMG